MGDYDVSNASAQYTDARTEWKSAKSNVENINAALNVAKTNSVWLASRGESVDSSNIDKLNDQLKAAKSQENLADAWDTYKGHSLQNKQMKQFQTIV